MVYLGLSETNSSYIVLALFLFFIIYPLIKAKNKVKHIIALSINLLFICSFWYIMGQSFNLDIMCSFMGSYILLGLDDFDFSGDVESVLGSLYHKKCIGDPQGPGGGPGGGPDLYSYLCTDTSDLESRNDNDMNDRLNILQNSPALHNYKEYIRYNDFEYNVSSLELDIKEYNDNIIYTKTNEFVFEKQKIKEYLEHDRKLNNYTFSRSSNVTPLEYFTEIQRDLYDYTLQYNTLKKAKFYYENKDLNLSKDYEIAFETWQKRQIAISIDNYYKLKMKSLPFDCHMPNWYQNSTVYDEVRENLIWTEYSLIKIKAIYDGLSAKKFNYLNINNSEFDNFVLQIIESHNENYKQCHNFLNENTIKSFDVDHMPKCTINCWYKKVCITDKQYLEYNDKYRGGKIGLGLAEKFSKKDFGLTNYMSDLYKNKYHDGKVGQALAKKVGPGLAEEVD